MTFEDEFNDKYRENVKTSRKMMTKAIDEVYKSTKSYKYSNEFDMIYKIVLGVKVKKFKDLYGLTKNEDILDKLTNEQLQAIGKLQLVNTELLRGGMKYQERKEKLTDIFNCREEYHINQTLSQPGLG
ncbi:MAG: hypothetical protein PHQ15_10260 [Methanosarcina sp.]|nr:hypothetical protein [Methanosarcina sp.]